MCENGRRPHSSCQPSTSTSSRWLSQSGASRPCGHATCTSAALSTPAVEFDNVSIVFGNDPRKALPLMDEGLDREAIKEATGQVLRNGLSLLGVSAR